MAGLGLYVNDAWYCSAACLEVAARERLARPSRGDLVTLTSIPALRLGVLLAHQAGLSREALSAALDEQRRTGRRLGAQLVAMGAATSHEVLRALAAQAGIGFLTAVDCARLLQAPGRLSQHAVRALGVVPFSVDASHEVMRVACTAPLPRLALGVMRELTGFRIEPYLVADDHFPALLEAYGASRADEPPADETVDDLGAAAARIVEAARSNRTGLRMAETRCRDHVWVRLEAEGRTEDLWLRTAASGLAVSTAMNG